MNPAYFDSNRSRVTFACPGCGRHSSFISGIKPTGHETVQVTCRQCGISFVVQVVPAGPEPGPLQSISGVVREGK